MNLSDRKCQALIPNQEKNYVDVGDFTTGLRFAVIRKAHGHYKRSFYFRYTCPASNRQRKLTIGVFPNVSIDRARDLAREMRELVRQEKSPKEALVGSSDGLTVAECLQIWMDKYSKIHRKSYYRDTTLQKRLLKDPALQTPVAKFTLLDATQMFERIASTGNRTAGMALGNIRTSLKFCARQGLIEHNPLSDYQIPKEGMSRQRARYLNDDELTVLISTLNSRLEDRAARIMLLQLRLGRRVSEICRLHVSEVNFEAMEIVLPPNRTKTGSELRLPIPQQAVDLLKGEPDEDGYLFGTSKASAISRYQRRLRSELGFPYWTTHDLRRTCRTMLARLRVPFEVAEAVLHHKIGGVAGIYDRWHYQDEMREALESYNNFLDSLLDVSER